MLGSGQPSSIFLSFFDNVFSSSASALAVFFCLCPFSCLRPMFDPLVRSSAHFQCHSKSMQITQTPNNQPDRTWQNGLFSAIPIGPHSRHMSRKPTSLQSKVLIVIQSKSHSLSWLCKTEACSHNHATKAGQQSRGRRSTTLWWRRFRSCIGPCLSHSLSILRWHNWGSGRRFGVVTTVPAGLTIHRPSFALGLPVSKVIWFCQGCKIWN